MTSTPFVQEPPKYLYKLNKHAGPPLLITDAVRCMADYNRWCDKFDKDEAAFQAFENDHGPDFYSPEGFPTCLWGGRDWWIWSPLEGGPSHYARDRQWRCSMLLRLRGYKFKFFPRTRVDPSQIIWGTWFNDFTDMRGAWKTTSHEGAS